MSEKLVYLSQEWAAEVKKRLQAELTPDKMNNLTSSMNNRYANCKNGENMYFYVAFENGAVSAVETGIGDGPAAEFTIQGDYAVFAQISQATLGAQRALMTGQLKLKGNMVKALKLASLVDRLNKIIATVPAEF
ncbi:MAG TPA: SCP2 sterol-binding domain-containing protein [Anaerolineaceae bacterium]|nr:SCP2 sterol-binding domain-containing protein [Anaerolineaceae bacterium]HPN51970.1 SCP2 sterol-binding domain-containing protein [Anaerolineaceae bacterium]